jgi:hypothetical protein
MIRTNHLKTRPCFHPQLQMALMPEENSRLIMLEQGYRRIEFKTNLIRLQCKSKQKSKIY